jgi:hypothetical protein
MSDAALWREIESLKRQLEELKTREKSPGAGTVTSVGLTMPTAVFDVAGSPVTGSGTLAVTFDSQTARQVFAAPTINGVPAFRFLTGDDITGIGSTQVLYGSGAGVITTEADFAYIEGDNELRVGRARLAEQATPTTPASGFSLLFAGSSGVNNGVASSVDDAGVVYQMARYAEGTFTPVLSGDGTAGTFTYDAANTGCDYTRHGNRMLLNGRVRITAIAVAPTGNMRITGLPFAGVAGAGSIAGGVQFDAVTGINLSAGYTWVGGEVVSSTSEIRLFENGDNVAAVRVQGAAFGLIGGVIDLRFWGLYQIAA